jgi:CheY-like chemotaxis protein
MTPSDLVLIEDDANDIDVALRAFRRHRMDHRVQVFQDGEQALDYLLGNGAAGIAGPKVVFLDLRMPRFDGWEFLRALRAEPRLQHLPVVVVTSSDRSGDVREAYRLGANSYVVKRFDAARPGEYLVDVARYWLEFNRVDS